MRHSDDEVGYDRRRFKAVRRPVERGRDPTWAVVDRSVVGSPRLVGWVMGRPPLLTIHTAAGTRIGSGLYVDLHEAVEFLVA